MWKVTTPITSFINALQTGEFENARARARAAAGKTTLVDSLSGLDREEGRAQHNRDKEWQLFTNLCR